MAKRSTAPPRPTGRAKAPPKGLGEKAPKSPSRARGSTSKSKPKK